MLLGWAMGEPVYSNFRLETLRPGEAPPGGLGTPESASAVDEDPPVTCVVRIDAGCKAIDSVV